MQTNARPVLMYCKDWKKSILKQTIWTLLSSKSMIQDMPENMGSPNCLPLYTSERSFPAFTEVKFL
jgi:hypothetical protein